MLLSLVACVPQVTSEQGQIIVEAADLKLIAAGEGTAPVLEGTVTCPVLLCAEDCPGQSTGQPDAIECFSVSSPGEPQLSGGCWTFSAPGEARVDFLTQPCAANAEGYDPIDDGLSFQVVNASELEAAPTDIELLVSQFLVPAPGEAFPTDWRQPDGVPWQIVEGQLFRLLPELRLAGQEVAWTLEQGGASAVSSAGGDPLLSYDDAEISVILEEGAASEIFFEVGEHVWPLAEVVGVSSEAPESLELVAGYFTDPTTGATEPAGVRAVVRDAGGALVWGSPLVWTLEQGLLAVGASFLSVPSADYLLVADECVPPSQNAGTHTALLRAEVDGLVATIELEWTVPEGLSDEGFAPSEDCVSGEQTPPVETTTDETAYVVDGAEDEEPELTEEDPAKGGCSCATQGRPGVGILLLGLLQLRRRGEGGSLVSQWGGKARS